MKICREIMFCFLLCSLLFHASLQADDGINGRAQEASPIADAVPLGEKVGIEVEFASEHSIRLEGIEDQQYERILMIAKRFIDGSEVHMEPWGRYPKRHLRKAIFRDLRNRPWQVVPESVNTTGLDGFELITPPLETDEDKTGFQNVVRAIIQSGEFGKGL